MDKYGTNNKVSITSMHMALSYYKVPIHTNLGDKIDDEEEGDGTPFFF
jgi:hypothetical protein